MRSIFSLLLFLALMISEIYVQGQIVQRNKNDFWDGVIVLNNGDSLFGLVQVPYDPIEKKVKIKKSNENESNSIDANSIESIIVRSDSGYVYKFDRFACRNNPKKNKLSKQKYFMMVYAFGDYATFYKISSYYSTERDGRIYIISEFTQGRTMPYISYCIKKKNYDFADIFAETSPSKSVFGLEKVFRTRSKYVLADDPKLLSMILNKELTLKDLDYIIELYLQDMAGK